ncbi:MAG: FAD-dependent oxidoreductase [Pseudomonadota bacterium]
MRQILDKLPKFDHAVTGTGAIVRRREFVRAALAGLAGGFVPLTATAGAPRVANGYLRTNWSRDPFSLGSYSYIAKGAWRRDHVALGAPVGDRLFFAGEATHPTYNSTVHAAYESGLLAAEAIAATRPQTIGIIGAGMSGLAAADALVRQGFDVTVLEGRDRVGGRILTDTSLGAALDLGASWIHGIEDNPLAALAERLRVTTRETSDSYVMRGGDGQRMADDATPDWLDDVVSIEHSAGAARRDINMRAYWRDDDYGGAEVVFPAGYAQLFDAFSSQIRIELGQAVARVRYTDAQVDLDIRDGSSRRFDAVIVTVPLGVLKGDAFTFDPPLPAQRQNAIAQLGMGLLDKVYMRYDNVFWDRDVTWIITPDTGLPPGQFNQWLNFHPLIGQPIIMAFNAAQPARDLARVTDAELIEKAQQVLHKAYPA